MAQVDTKVQTLTQPGKDIEAQRWLQRLMSAGVSHGNPGADVKATERQRPQLKDRGQPGGRALVGQDRVSQSLLLAYVAPAAAATERPLSLTQAPVQKT